MFDWGWEEDEPLIKLNIENESKQDESKDGNADNDFTFNFGNGSEEGKTTIITEEKDLFNENKLSEESEDLSKKSDSIFGFDEEEEIDLAGMIAEVKDKENYYYGKKKIVANIAKDNKEKRKSNLPEEYLYKNKGTSLDGEGIGIFHNNQQHGKLGSINLHEEISSIGFEGDLKEYKDDFIGALGQSKVLNDKAELVKIGEDGTTVADLIRAKRRKKKNNIKSNIRESKVEAIKNNLENPLYLKSFKKAQEKLESKIEKYGISKESIKTTGKKKSDTDNSSYIKRLRSGNGYTNLLKTLDMNSNELMEVLSKDNRLLSQEEKEKVLGMGITDNTYNTTMRNKNGNRLRGAKRLQLTFSDYELLDFVYRFEYSGLTPISIGLNKSIEQVAKQVDKLMKMGCIIEQQILGTKYVYYISPVGYTILTGVKMERPLGKIKEGSISNKAITNYVGAILYSGCQNILRDDRFGEHNRYFKGDYYLGETIIPERIYKSGLGSLVGNSSFVSGVPRGSKRNQIGGSQVNRLWGEWERKGKLEGEPSPDEVSGNEFMYVLYPRNIRDVNSVTPDLVVKRSRSSDGSSNNIAIEIERESRRVEYYVNRLRAYQQDNKIYKEVVYIVNKKSVAEKIMKARDTIGFDRVKIVPLITNNKEIMPVLQDVWRLI